MGNNALIDELVKHSSLRSIRRLKEELKIEKNSSLIHFLIDYLINQIQNIDFSTDPADLLEVIRVLNCIRIENEKDFNTVEESLKKIRDLIKSRKEKLENSKGIYDSLCEIEDAINTFLLTMNYEKMNQKFMIPEINIGNKKIKSIVYDLIFKYKSIGHLNLLLSLYPTISNIKYDNDEPLIFQIFCNYFAMPEERDFLSKVIIMFITSVRFSLDDSDKKTLQEIFNNYGHLLNEKDSIFIKEVMTFLDIQECLSAESDMASLKTRYGLADVQYQDRALEYEYSPVDMTDRNVIAIDCDGVVVRDDAISITRREDGAIELGVYLTDLSAVKECSEMDEYARNHFATIYVRNNWVPMFPAPLIRQFSLDEGLRRVMAFTYTFSPKLELEDCQINSAIINVRNCLNYEDVLRILTEGGELYPFLKEMADLSESIEDSLGTISKYHRLKNIAKELGGISPALYEQYRDTYGSRIVSTVSIFLNNYVATMFSKAGLPFIYKVNSFESSLVIDSLMKKYHSSDEASNMLKSLQVLYKPSTFSATNTGHKGLGLDAYTQATNPARFYPSLVIQRMLQDLFVAQIPIDEYIRKYQDVESRAEEFTRLQQRNRDFTVEYNKMFRKLR